MKICAWNTRGGKCDHEIVKLMNLKQQEKPDVWFDIETMTNNIRSRSIVKATRFSLTELTIVEVYGLF